MKSIRAAVTQGRMLSQVRVAAVRGGKDGWEGTRESGNAGKFKTIM